jgi:hypothetical protein
VALQATVERTRLAVDNRLNTMMSEQSQVDMDSFHKAMADQLAVGNSLPRRVHSLEWLRKAEAAHDALA